MGTFGTKELTIASICVVLGGVSLFGQLLCKTPQHRPAIALESFKTSLVGKGTQFAAVTGQNDLMTDGSPCVRAEECTAPAAIKPLQLKAEKLDLARIAKTLAEIESAGNPELVGLHGERGLMQIKSATWESVTRRLYGSPLDFNRAFEKELNLKVGTAYLEELKSFLGTHQAEWQDDERLLLMACYNAGPTRVASTGFAISALPFQTQDYVARADALASDL